MEPLMFNKNGSTNIFTFLKSEMIFMFLINVVQFYINFLFSINELIFKDFSFAYLHFLMFYIIISENASVNMKGSIPVVFASIFVALRLRY